MQTPQRDEYSAKVWVTVLHDSLSLKRGEKARCCPSACPIMADYIIHSFVFCWLSSPIMAVVVRKQPRGRSSSRVHSLDWCVISL